MRERSELGKKLPHYHGVLPDQVQRLQHRGVLPVKVVLPLTLHVIGVGYIVLVGLAVIASQKDCVVVSQQGLLMVPHAVSAVVWLRPPESDINHDRVA